MSLSRRLPSRNSSGASTSLAAPSVGGSALQKRGPSGLAVSTSALNGSSALLQSWSSSRPRHQRTGSNPLWSPFRGATHLADIVAPASASSASASSHSTASSIEERWKQRTRLLMGITEPPQMQTWQHEYQPHNHTHTQTQKQTHTQTQTQTQTHAFNYANAKVDIVSPPVIMSPTAAGRTVASGVGLATALLDGAIVRSENSIVSNHISHEPRPEFRSLLSPPHDSSSGSGNGSYNGQLHPPQQAGSRLQFSTSSTTAASSATGVPPSLLPPLTPLAHRIDVAELPPTSTAAVSALSFEQGPSTDSNAIDIAHLLASLGRSDPTLADDFFLDDAAEGEGEDESEGAGAGAGASGSARNALYLLALEADLRDVETRKGITLRFARLNPLMVLVYLGMTAANLAAHTKYSSTFPLLAGAAVHLAIQRFMCSKQRIQHEQFCTLVTLRVLINVVVGMLVAALVAGALVNDGTESAALWYLCIVPSLVSYLMHDLNHNIMYLWTGVVFLSYLAVHIYSGLHFSHPAYFGFAARLVLMVMCLGFADASRSTLEHALRERERRMDWSVQQSQLLVQARNEAIIAAEAAAAAGQAKAQFLANMSHEIRTPRTTNQLTNRAATNSRTISHTMTLSCTT